MHLQNCDVPLIWDINEHTYTHSAMIHAAVDYYCILHFETTWRKLSKPIDDKGIQPKAMYSPLIDSHVDCIAYTNKYAKSIYIYIIYKLYRHPNKVPDFIQRVPRTNSGWENETNLVQSLFFHWLDAPQNPTSWVVPPRHQIGYKKIWLITWFSP